MGFAAIASSNTTQTGSFLSQVSTAVNTAVDADTGTITAAANWTGAVDGQAFAIIRGGSIIAVRCVKSFTTTVLTYYRFYKEDGTELTTDVQVGDTITLYEQPQLVVGTALGSIAGITLTTTGTGATALNQFTMGNNSITASGFLQLPARNILLFGTASPNYSVIVSSTGRLAVGAYKTIDAYTVTSSGLVIRGTKTEANSGGSNTTGVLNLKNAACRTDWFGSRIEASALCFTDGTATGNTSTTTIYSKNAKFVALGSASGAAYQCRIYSDNFLSYGFTTENSSIVLISTGIELNGYNPQQNDMALTYSSATPTDTWITVTDPALKTGNVVGNAFWFSKWSRVVNNETGSNLIVGGNDTNAQTNNRGLHEYRANVTASIKNVGGTGVTGRIFCRDTNNGSRLAASQIGANPSYTSDRTYESVITAGAASFTTDGGVLLATARQNVSASAVTRFASITWDYRGLDNSSTDRFSFALAAYGYEPATTIAVLKGIGGVTVAYTMLDDLGITANRATVAGYSSKFTIDGSGNITVIDNATLDELYDYSQYWLEQSGSNMEAVTLGQKLFDYSGSAIDTTKNITVNATKTLSNGTKYTSIITTGTITINGSMNVSSYTSVAGTFVKLSVLSLTSGSRIQLYNVDDSVEIYNAIVGATSYSQYVQYTADKAIRLRATYVSGVTAKQGYEATGTLTENGLSFTAAQVDCDVYIAYGIDGSTVAGFTADYVNDDVDLTTGTNFYLTELFAWWKYNETTSQGISDFFGGMTAIDEGNIRVNNSIVSIYLDNSTSTTIWAIDNRRFFRSDGARPIRFPTAGGGDIDVEWREPVLFVNDANILAIKAKTDNLPADPASATNVTTAQTALTTEINANEAKIDLLETKTQADARQVILVAEHDATQSAIAGLNNLSLAQVEASTVLAKQASLVTINQGVKNASILVPYTSNL